MARDVGMGRELLGAQPERRGVAGAPLDEPRGVALGGVDRPLRLAARERNALELVALGFVDGARALLVGARHLAERLHHLERRMRVDEMGRHHLDADAVGRERRGQRRRPRLLDRRAARW